MLWILLLKVIFKSNQRAIILKIIYLALVELELPGGPTVHTLNLMKGFQQRNTQVRLLCPKPSRPITEINTFDCHFIPFWGYGPCRLFLFNMLAVIKLIYNIMFFKPDVIYLRDRPGNIFAIIWAKIFRLPFFIEMNGVLLEDFADRKSPKKVGIHHFLRKKAFLWAKGLIFNCSQLCGKYSEEYEIPIEKTSIVSMHVDCDLFKILPKDECRKKLKIPPEAFVLGYVGGFSSRHNVEILKGIQNSLEKLDKKSFILLVGDTPNKERKKALLTGLDHERIMITGWIPHSDIPFYINMMDIGTAFVNEIEGNDSSSFLKVKEYLACGVPVILNSKDPDAFNEYPKNSVIVLSNKDICAISVENLVKGIVEFNSKQNQTNRKKMNAYIQKKYNLNEAAKQTAEFFAEKLNK